MLGVGNSARSALRQSGSNNNIMKIEDHGSSHKSFITASNKNLPSLNTQLMTSQSGTSTRRLLKTREVCATIEESKPIASSLVVSGQEV